MGQIIEFKRKPGAIYRGLLAAIQQAEENDTLTGAEILISLFSEEMAPAECNDLMEKIREKRIELFAPQKKPAQVADKPGLYQYTQEMGEQEPQGCQLTASRGYYGGHWFVDSPEPLKGRGIILERRYTAADFSDGAKNPHVGWYGYKVTNRAFEKLKEHYSISHETFLD